MLADLLRINLIFFYNSDSGTENREQQRNGMQLWRNERMNLRQKVQQNFTEMKNKVLLEKEATSLVRASLLCALLVARCLVVLSCLIVVWNSDLGLC